MILVRQVQKKRTILLDNITHASKNLYNVALYTTRQRFFKNRHWIRYNNLWKMLKNHPDYLTLKNLCGSHPPQHVLKQVDVAWKSFFNAMKEWNKNPSKFINRPNLPHYKSTKGYNMVYFTAQQCRLIKGHVHLTNKVMQRGFKPIKTDLLNVKGVRIIPCGDRYNIELIFERTPNDLNLKKTNILGIDLGINNLVTASDNCGGQPLLIKGGAVKSINQFYNKNLAIYYSHAKICNKTHSTNKIERLHRLRKNKIRDFFHKTSQKIIETCVGRNIGTIVIGYNEGWKRKVNLGKNTNQKFVVIPFLKLVSQIEYKAALFGIDIIRVTEEYTSQTCSKCGIVRKGNRKYRGLYVCNKCGMTLNADVNASINILQKGVPDSFWIGDRGCLNHPAVLVI